MAPCGDKLAVSDEQHALHVLAGPVSNASLGTSVRPAAAGTGDGHAGVARRELSRTLRVQRRTTPWI